MSHGFWKGVRICYRHFPRTALSVVWSLSTAARVSSGETALLPHFVNSICSLYDLASFSRSSLRVVVLMAPFVFSSSFQGVCRPIYCPRDTVPLRCSHPPIVHGKRAELVLFRPHLIRFSSPVGVDFSLIRMWYISGAGMLMMSLSVSEKSMNSCLFYQCMFSFNASAYCGFIFEFAFHCV